MIGEILNVGDNVDDQETFGFTGSYSKIAPTNKDDYIENKFLNMQQENLRPQKNRQNNDKQTDEIYQKFLIDDKESDEIDQISKYNEERIIEDIEIMKLQNFSSQKIYKYILRKNLMK